MQSVVEFDQQGMAELLAAMDTAALDALTFGVIGFDLDNHVRRYNAYESQAAGLGSERVLDQDLFMVVAPCLNNFLVAQRFSDAREAGVALDDTINYVLT